MTMTWMYAFILIFLRAYYRCQLLSTVDKMVNKSESLISQNF